MPAPQITTLKLGFRSDGISAGVPGLEWLREGRVLIMKEVSGLGLDLGENTSPLLLDK